MRLPSFHPLVLTLIDKLKLKRRLFFNVSVENPKLGPNDPMQTVKYESSIEKGTSWESPYLPDYTYQNPEKVNNTFIHTNGTQVKKNEYNKKSPETVEKID